MFKSGLRNPGGEFSHYYFLNSAVSFTEF